MGWYNFESSKGVYDFAALDHILGKLNPLGKKLSLNMLSSNKTEPAYITAESGVTTWTFTDQNTRHEDYGKPQVKPVPWDSYLQSRFSIFAEKLANYQSPNPAGGTIALRDNPALAQIIVTIPGLGSIREGPGGAATPELSTMPGYSRQVFIDAILAALRAIARNFPQKPISVPFFHVTDTTTSPSLDQTIHDAIQAEFDGVKNPKVGYFQENLSALNTTGSILCSPDGSRDPLKLATGKTWLAFQMLQSWVTPFANPSKNAGTIPTDAISCGNSLMGITYFEVYVPDLDNAAWHASFRDWAAKLK